MVSEVGSLEFWPYQSRAQGFGAVLESARALEKLPGLSLDMRDTREKPH